MDARVTRHAIDQGAHPLITTASGREAAVTELLRFSGHVIDDELDEIHQNVCLHVRFRKTWKFNWKIIYRKWKHIRAPLARTNEILFYSNLKRVKINLFNSWTECLMLKMLKIKDN